MKIKLDENIPVRVVGILNQLGHETDTISHRKRIGRHCNGIEVKVAVVKMISAVGG